MGSCIICGSSAEGRICDLHEEDVVFEFRGSNPDELTIDRYYRGTVDGYAEFGVFVDIGDSVTGLLHRSELDRRLDSLDWEPGDTVFVQVKNVRDNGNVDLAWSIRQDETEFRGTLVDDPSTDGGPTLADREADEGNGRDAGNGNGPATGAASGAGTGGVDPGDGTAGSPAQSPDAGPAERTEEASVGATDGQADGRSGQGASAAGQQEVAAGSSGAVQATAETADRDAESATVGEAAEREPVETTVDTLGDHVGDLVRLEGEITDAHQTSGPTIFTLRDET
jgi:RecJ-like exonuclease